MELSKELLGRMLERLTNQNEIRHGNHYFVKRVHSWWEENDGSRSMRGIELFVPSGRQDWTFIGVVSNLYYLWAMNSAPLLRKAILDEDLPVYQELIAGCWSLPGGRKYDATLLGLMIYEDAMPELLEAATHDLDYWMRCNSVEALGMFEKKAKPYASGIAKILLDDKSLIVRKHAANSLQDIDDKSNPVVASALRDTVEDTRYNIEMYTLFGYYNKAAEDRRMLEDTNSLYEAALAALLVVDATSGLEEMRKGINSTNGFIYHHTKNAVFWSGIRKQLILPKKL